MFRAFWTNNMRGADSIIYLHGLGSSPESPKARLIANAVLSRGLVFSAPNLSLPSLERLSVDAAIDGFVKHFRGRAYDTRIALVASSFGAFIALHGLKLLSDLERSRITQLVLLAPALYPWHPRFGVVTPQVEQVWREKGVFPIEHGATGESVLVHYEFIQQLTRYSTDELELEHPISIIHGLRDEVVPIEQSRTFKQRHPSIELEVIDDNHQLMANPELLLDFIERRLVGQSAKHS